MVNKIKLLIVGCFISFSLSGCVAELMLAGTAVSVASTAQEVEEEHNNNFFSYVESKWTSLKSYIERKTSN
ncbi:hypothetical protein [Arcobacter sp. FWKO B]|uniref:hypothetical protein n=1 Tax=Arcobacter sp. FWKO B TaxID=2593672 RepID=UPI0018A59BF5|nr:hypothetical protein [Arcobacter sp. FWKO B]QOG13072.1 hypothetical protein FWKOB_10405 [Arcobacter sp. FWKO B]